MQFATEFGSFVFLVTGIPSLQVSIRVSGWQSGSMRRFEGLKQRDVRKIQLIVTSTDIYISLHKTGHEEIVGS